MFSVEVFKKNFCFLNIALIIFGISFSMGTNGRGKRKCLPVYTLKTIRTKIKQQKIGRHAPWRAGRKGGKKEEPFLTPSPKKNH